MNSNSEMAAGQPVMIRIVLDGAPLAGKTTAAYALSEALGGTTSTPAEDFVGRTSWFDWMDFTGGRHEGRPIRVELTTVPGQRHLNDRRKYLLGWGDVVVFVADTQVDAFEQSVTKFFDLKSDTRSRDIPVIVVANKRDLDRVVSIDTVRERFDLTDDDTLVEGIATSGSGIRQAFIFAVRSVIARSGLHEKRTSPEELLAEMQAVLGDAPEPNSAAEGDVSAIGSESESVEPQSLDLASAAVVRCDLNPGFVDEVSGVILSDLHWRLIVAIADDHTVRVEDEAQRKLLTDLNEWGLVDLIAVESVDDSQDDADEQSALVADEQSVGTDAEASPSIANGQPIHVAAESRSAVVAPSMNTAVEPLPVAPSGASRVAVTTLPVATSERADRAGSDPAPLETRNARYRALRELRLSLRGS